MDSDRQPQPVQFSLWDLLVLVSVLAIGMGLLRAYPILIAPLVAIALLFAMPLAAIALISFCEFTVTRFKKLTSRQPEIRDLSSQVKKVRSPLS